jgi:hypothetical protein
LPRRELDQTICPFALPPTEDIACFSAALGVSSLPLGPPPMVAHPAMAEASAASARPRLAVLRTFDESRFLVN